MKQRELEAANLPYFGEDSGLRRILSNVAADLALAIEKEIAAHKTRSQELVWALQSGENAVLTALVPSDKSRLAAIVKAMENEAKALQIPDVKERLNTLANELRELQHRRITLSSCQRSKPMLKHSVGFCTVTKILGQLIRLPQNIMSFSPRW